MKTGFEEVELFSIERDLFRRSFQKTTVGFPNNSVQA